MVSASSMPSPFWLTLNMATPPGQGCRGRHLRGSTGNPAEYTDRMDVWESDIRDQWHDRGYHDGLEAARRELSPHRPE
jgi:hypothetical protein